MEARSSGKLKEIESRPRGITAGVPMRVHEILGLPKSIGKTVQLPISHRKPVRVKELLRSMESPAKKNPRCSGIGKSQTSQALGLSKSDGKAKTGLMSQPVRVKDLFASTEKSRNEKFSGNVTIHESRHFPQLSNTQRNFPRPQPFRVKELLGSSDDSDDSGKKTAVVGVRTKRVRRKLYATSPIYQQNHGRKSIAPNKIQENIIKSRTIVRHDNVSQKTASEKSSRKSFLRPPNSIRDEHIVRKVSMIHEETKLALEVENKDNQSKEEDFLKIPTKTEATETHIEIPSHRPSVIMGLATARRKEKPPNEKSNESGDKWNTNLFSRLPIPEAQNRRSMIPSRRLDSASTSLEDSSIQSDSRVDPRRSNSFHHSPSNSLIRNLESSSSIATVACMDSQTRAWLHGNLKLCIQMTEENLFTMKQMLKTIEDTALSRPEEMSSMVIPAAAAAAAAAAPANDGTPNISGIEVADNDDPLEISRKKCVSLPIVGSIDVQVSEGAKQASCRDDFIEDDDENKENSVNGEQENEILEMLANPRRRSARLAAIETRSPKGSDGSFTRLETQLNITHEKSKTERKATPIKKTPAKRIHMDPRCNRSLREYMALKSSTKFLQTPDQKGLPTPKGEKYGTPAQRRANDRALSRTVLKQLNDLYD